MQVDEILRRQLLVFVELHGGSASQAADALELPRVFVWRFLKTGKAIPRNVAKLRRALEGVPERRSAASSVETRGKSKEKQREEFRFSRSDVAKMRLMLQYLIAALDAYGTSDVDISPRPDRAGSPY
jgi:hypothetical protein